MQVLPGKYLRRVAILFYNTRIKNRKRGPAVTHACVPKRGTSACRHEPRKWNEDEKLRSFAKS